MTVAGDLNGVAGDVVIAESGVITGDVSVATGSLRIAGTVDGSVSAGASAVSLTQTGAVAGDFSVGAATVTIDGTIGADATVGADTITLGPTSQIDGELRYDGALTQQSGAVVQGPVVEDSPIGGFGPVGISGDSWETIGWLDSLYGLFANLLLGAILLFSLPRFSNRVATQVVDSTGRSALLGLLVLITVPFILALTAVTIVGIPLAILGVFASLSLIWVGIVNGEFAVGRWLLGRWQDEPNRWFALGLGLVLFTVIGAVPIVGGLAMLAVLLVGLGALAAALRGTYRRRSGRISSTTAPQNTDSTMAA
ncbi:bactofilin family protein [Halodesulfurarchaeum sp.]|uniref:bactofilin family protein n=2 Tax=Halodesulfurarchaeum sp. TaxID=1980530 RepID=UPI001BC1036A|nr:polymer-forming cytoskeletal protein [Halodesulfurarchaeum sp.]